MLYDLGPRARRVFDVLLDRIRSGELAPGTRLPSHTRLAEAFGVAPLTIRQVLARLEADRLLVRERGRGTFVRATHNPQVLVVAADPAARTALAAQVQQAGRSVMLAATPAEGLAALDREPWLALVVVDLHLPAARDGLTFVRRLRRRKPDLPVAVLDPTRRQRSRLEHTVAPPLLIVSHPISDQLAQLLRVQLAGTQPTPPSGDAAPAQQVDDLLERYVALQLAGERAAARALVLHEGVGSGLSVADLYRRVLQPAQYRVGELWQANQISVAREHLATAVTGSVLVEAAAAAPRAPSTGMRVLVACVEGELHDLGARMVADLLELDGFAVRFLGADVPTDSLLAMIDEERPHLLVLSVTMAERLAQLRAAVARLRQVHGSRVPIFVGGQVLDWVPDLARTVDVDLAARDALDTLEAARRSIPVRAVGTARGSPG
jgi:methanogenic corrinoid protein MtbC1/DNA-binding transcriptional regulator YhcF (GntR family)